MKRIDREKLFIASEKTLLFCTNCKIEHPIDFFNKGIGNLADKKYYCRDSYNKKKAEKRKLKNKINISEFKQVLSSNLIELTEERMEEKTWEIIEELKNKILIKWPKMTFNFQVIINKRMKSSAGKAFSDYKWENLSLHLNYRMLKDNPNELKPTVIHELAHLIQHNQYQDSSHGYIWKNIMGYLGLCPQRTHNMDATKYGNNNYLYSCKCGQIHSVSSIRHKRIQKEISSYSCNKTNFEILKDNYVGKKEKY